MITEKHLDYCVTDTQRERVQAYLDYGSQYKAADAMGCSRSKMQQTLRQVRVRAAKAGYAPEHGMVDTAPDGFSVKGTSTLYDRRSGDAVMQWVKTNQDHERQLELMREAVQALCEDLPRMEPVKSPQHNMEDLMSLYPMGDPHVGMLSWAAETGDDFDVEIAERDLCAAVDYLVDRSPPSKRGVLINLGDFYHAENMQGMTTRSGHVLDMDTRFARMIAVGMRTLMRCINRMLEKHEQVEIVNAPGNHDETVSLFMTESFKLIYEQEPRVVVHAEPTMRHYIEHGKCLVGVVHGHQTKDRDLPGIMATEKPEAWGRTRYRYYYRGHHHHDERTEYNGCIVEQFRTLAAGDAYAVGHGYLSGRDMKCIVMHKEYGEQSRFTCGIDVLRDRK